MSASTQTASSAPRSFAGLLADLTSPEKKFPPARDLDGLADDIATLSYEHALKTHARYRPSPDHALSPETQPSQPAFPGSLPLFAAGPESDELVREDRQADPAAQAAPLRDSVRRKCASVTVRLTHAEDEQLRQRAAEAGLTVSAYLRSCAFEVETLRAQVKQTIAEMRHAEPPPVQNERKGAFSRLFMWRKRSAA